MYKTIFLILITFLAINSVKAQSSSRTNEIKISSKILNEVRTIKIHLPEGYSEEKVYPVIYATDGSFDIFDIAKGYIDILTMPSTNVIPPPILVGIVHKNRSNELRAFGNWDGKQFIQFIEKELVPYVDSTYSTSSFNTMIGHSDGAEFNHYLMTSKGNPFRGFISLSPAFNEDMKPEIAQYYTTYDKAKLYQFVANASRDIASRIAAGNSIDSLYQATANKNISFKNQTYKADHESLMAIALLDGLQFIFQDYRNRESYSSIVDYGENYLQTLKNRYGIDAEYKLYDIDQFLTDIIERKDIEEYQYCINLINENNLVFGQKMDPVNMAWHYSDMEFYSKTIESMNKAIEEFDSPNIYPNVFYLHVNTAQNAYIKEGRTSEVVSFLERCRAVLPERYYLRMSYRIAHFSLNNNVDTRSGREALDYCKKNFKENKLFSMDDLTILEQK